MKVEASPGSLEDGAALFVPVMDHLRVQGDRLSRIKSPVAGLHAEDVAGPVELPEPHHELPDHGVHPGAEAPARDYGCSHVPRLEVDRPPWPGPVVCQVGPRGGVGGVVEDVTEDDVGGVDVELGGGVEEGVAVERVRVRREGGEGVR